MIRELRADDAEVTQVARLRWTEWGDEQGAGEVADWAELTRSECRAEPDGRLPVTVIAVTDGGEVLGAVGLVSADPERLPDRGPWVVGTVVRRDARGQGLGRRLVAGLERHAVPVGPWWVSTQSAAPFYVACGFRPLPGTRSILSLAHEAFEE